MLDVMQIQAFKSHVLVLNVKLVFVVVKSLLKSPLFVYKAITNIIL